MSSNGCCRGLPSQVCFARPYGCFDGPSTQEYPDQLHPSHETRISDASSFDEICIHCGATDRLGSWGNLRLPCKGNKSGRWRNDGHKS